MTVPAADAAAPRQGDDLFRLLVASVRDYAIILLDPAGHVASWNAGAERTKGYPAQEVLGRHCSVFYPPEAIAAGVPAAALRAAAAAGRWEGEGWRLRRDGGRFWADVVITALRDEAGELVGYAKVTRDLTERKRAEEERAALLAAERAARAEARATAEALRERDAFLSVAAHELRTPVAGLRAAAQLAERRLAREGAARPERLAPILATVTAQAGKLARLIDRLLDLSRLEGGRLALDWERADLAALAGRVVDEARARVEGRAIGLVAPAALEAVVDPLRVEQVLTNLLDNALKYAPQGPIAVALARRGATAELAVQDRGPGVPPGRRARLFERYYRAHEGGGGGGLGLGLYLAREIAERHGGRLEAEFPPEGGARFVLTLPLAPAGART